MPIFIDQHLNHVNLDIRTMSDARFLDQKCTPDVVSFIADCIVNSISNGQSFTKEDIWHDNYFIKTCQAIFGKPAPTIESADKEYDKFIGQPLKLFAYAKLLNLTIVKGVNTYSINNLPILDYISRREYNAYEFLASYVNKLLIDSNLMRSFQSYEHAHINGTISNDDYTLLRDSFVRYIHGNTNIKGDYEPRRIFPKILNVYAVNHGLRGSVRGRISKNVFVYSDLMYNRVNWRDTNKAKYETREQSAQSQTNTTQNQSYASYVVQRAKNTLKRIQGTTSEVSDMFATGKATHAHHIFPESSFPQIAAYVENLILLTAAQHLHRAHPNGNTSTIDRSYQQACLLCKADTIEKSVRMYGPMNYSKSNFLYVLQEGFGLPQAWPASLSFSEIKQAIIQYYQAHP